MNDSCFDVPSSASDAVEWTNVTAGVRGSIASGKDWLLR